MGQLTAVEYGQVKLVGFAASFALSATIQALAPYRNLRGQILKNWFCNISVATLNAIAMSLACHVCDWSQFLFERQIGLFNQIQVPFWVEGTTVVVFLDLLSYFWHRMNHTVPVLWRFHAVHHTDRVFESTLAVRFHLGELLISFFVRIVGFSIFGFSLQSILLFEIIFQFFNFFEHGNIRLPERVERVLSILFVTPAVHLKHHSVEWNELNTNFGTIFSVWDRLFGSWRSPFPRQNVVVGLKGFERALSFYELLLLPLKGVPVNSRVSKSSALSAIVLAISINGKIGAADGIRTRDTQLGKLVLYQLSYCRTR